MRRVLLLVAALIFSLAGIAWAQPTAPADPLFVPLRQIGQLRPQGIRYDPNFDRLVWVDELQRLLLVDAATYQPLHTLYESGAYNAYQFSHDGRWLALALDRRVELWDTSTGERASLFEPPGANLVQGPLHFTPDDKYLLLDTVVPAPQELRRSENDTSIIPWLWDLEAARGERSSRFPSLEDGYAFFEYRNGLIVGANTILIGGIPNRLMVIDGATNNFSVTAEIPANRFERDPIVVWRSATDSLLYTDPMTGEGIVQVNTETGTAFSIPLGRNYNYTNVEQLQAMRIANNGRELCPASGLVETSLLRFIYGPNYLSYQNYQPLTFTLIDVLEPMTLPQDQGSLLMYTYNQQRGRGSIELIRPPDTLQLRLSPDRTRLMVRRISGAQPIEIYNLEDCSLERTIYPAEPDPSAQHTLEFNRDGSVIVSDFQRFDTYTGETLAHVINYTQGFGQIFFGDDRRTIATVRNNTWELWDIQTGRPLQRAALNIGGQVLAQTPDASRYLTRTDTEAGALIEIVDLKQQTRRALNIPQRQGIQQIIPAASWEEMLVVYSSQNGTEVAVYNFDSGLRFLASGDDLPADIQQFGWIDSRTIYAAGSQFGSLTPRIYGVDYDPSGLPACLVRTFPDDYTQWLPLWEALNYRLQPDQLARLSRRLCDALPASADAVVEALTPTTPFVYLSNPTPIPYNIPGVPQCLTEYFAYEATDYAALWREISAGLDETQRAELERMICEGLIGSVYGVQPTPTINPNLDVPPTPTPVDAAPQTTGGGETYRPRIVAIDIETQQRSEGDYLPPPSGPEVPDASLLYNFFANQFNRPPNNFQVSPDGQLAAELDPNGFVIIYRLSRSLDLLLADEANALATRQAENVRSIGLVPTSTESYQPLGEIRPTLTPTITPTPPPLAQSTPENWQNDQIETVCPAQQLYTVDNPPPGYAATGRLFAAPPTGPNAVWVLEPEDGRLYADDSLPMCGIGETCVLSFDNQWAVRMVNQVIVSKPDGSQATILANDPNYFPYSFNWLPGHTLRFSYSSYLPEIRPGQGEVLRDFDPETGALSEPFASPDLIDPVEIGELPTSIVSAQPGGSLLVVSTPYGNVGTKYYLYDRETGSAEYFARSEGSSLYAEWHPLGHTLYYTFGSNEQFAYDTRTRQHYQMPGGLPNANWSPDGQHKLYWFSDRYEDEQQRIEAGELPLKLELWDAQTGARRRFCLPETGTQTFGGQGIVWSPDSRYVAFTVSLPIEGDYFPEPGPTAVPYTPQPTSTAVPLETQYEFGYPRTIVLDTETGYATIISTDIRSLILWTDDGGAQ